MNTNNNAKTILCYGDSNTWGNVPRSNERYSRSVRWSGALQILLGSEYEVISEGLCGRTFVAEDQKKIHRTGITHLQTILESHDPVDALIIMLGTNDVKSTYNLSAQDIAGHLEQTIKLVRSDTLDLEKVPQIIVVCPPPVIHPTAAAKSSMGQELDARMLRGVDIFKELPLLYKQVAENNNCTFVNAGDYISSSLRDGYHLDPESHQKLAEALAAVLVEVMSNNALSVVETNSVK